MTTGLGSTCKSMAITLLLIHGEVTQEASVFTILTTTVSIALGAWMAQMAGQPACSQDVTVALHVSRVLLAPAKHSVSASCTSPIFISVQQGVISTGGRHSNALYPLLQHPKHEIDNATIAWPFSPHVLYKDRQQQTTGFGAPSTPRTSDSDNIPVPPKKWV